MTAALISTAVLALLTTAVLLAVAAHLRARLVELERRFAAAEAESLVGKTLIVHTRKPDDQSIRGVCVAQHTDRWSFRDAVYRHSSGEQPIGHLVHVPVANLSWYQEIEADGS